MGVMGFSTLKIGARAVAVLKGEGTACVLALNKTASGAAVWLWNAGRSARL